MNEKEYSYIVEDPSLDKWETFLKNALTDKFKSVFKFNTMAVQVFIDKYFDSIFKEIYLYVPRATGDPSKYNVDKLDKYLNDIVNSFFIKIKHKVYDKLKELYGDKQLISDKDFNSVINGFNNLVFGGSIMAGLFNDTLTSLSNCFVVGVPHDSYNGILQTEQHMVNIIKRRGGVGTDLTFIRPAGSRIHNAARISTGVVPFVKRYSRAIMEVSATEGRRGAGMITLDINHSDAVELINAKTNTSEMNGVNISMKVDDRFMKTIIRKDEEKEGGNNGQRRIRRGRRLDEANIIEIAPERHDGFFTHVSREEIFNLLVKNATNYAEPGILFWDRIEEQIDSMIYGSVGFSPYSTNPCGEIPMSPYSSCILASINLYSYVSNPFTENAEFDIKRFKRDVYSSQVILDAIVSLEKDNIKSILSKLLREKNNIRTRNYGKLLNKFKVLDDEINMWTKILEVLLDGRRTGLGMMGYADAVAALGFRYGDGSSINFMEDISKYFRLSAYKASIDMAERIGKFNVCNPKGELGFGKSNVPFLTSLIDELKEDDKSYLTKWKKTGRRNIQLLAIAPTGTISMMSGVSSGIEPVFSLRYKRRRRAVKGSLNIIYDKDGNSWEEFYVVHPKFIEWAKINGIKDDLEKVDDNLFDEIVKKSPYYKATTYDIDPFNKIILQGILQKRIDNSISITHNLKKDATEETVRELIISSYINGNKGITIYREGSRVGILVDKNDDINKKKTYKRPVTLKADVHYTTVRGDKYIVIVGLKDDKPYEVFAYKTKSKPSISKGFIKKTPDKKYQLLDLQHNIIVEDIAAEFEAVEDEFGTRMISAALISGADLSFIYKQLIRSKGDITHFSKAIARILSKYIKASDSNGICPVCGSKRIIMKEGCMSCIDCGWSKCG